MREGKGVDYMEYGWIMIAERYIVKVLFVLFLNPSLG